MKISTRDMILVSLFTALTAVGAFLSIPIGNVPITLQSMFTILSGLILGPKLGSLSQLIYVILGLAGVKIFAGFSGGPQTVFSPSFGFLIGFIFASYIVGIIANTNEGINFKRIILATLAGTATIYIFGVPYMYLIINKVLLKEMSFLNAMKVGCVIFLPGDLLKCFASSYVAMKVVPKVNINTVK